jgi:hypothetical protein
VEDSDDESMPHLPVKTGKKSVRRPTFHNNDTQAGSVEVLSEGADMELEDPEFKEVKEGSRGQVLSFPPLVDSCKVDDSDDDAPVPLDQIANNKVRSPSPHHHTFGQRKAAVVVAKMKPKSKKVSATRARHLAL